VLVTGPGAAFGQVSSAGLIGHWPLDGNTNDISGNGHDGTIIGSPQPTIGAIGGAYNFDGASGIDVGNLDFSSGKYTVSGWVRTREPAVIEVWRNWIAKFDYPAGNATFELFAGDGRALGGYDSPLFIVWSTGNGVVSNPGSPSLYLRDGDW